MTSTGWIALLAYEARIRYAAERRHQDAVAVRLGSARSRVVAGLRCAIALDIETFLCANHDHAPASLSCLNAGPAQGFIVARMDDGVGTQRLAVDLIAGTLICRYDICGAGIDRASDRRVLAIGIESDGATASLWEEGRTHKFATVDALSAFLLAPILGARGVASRV